MSQSNSEVQYYKTDFSADISYVSWFQILIGDILVLHQTVLLLQKGHNPHSIIHHSTSMWNDLHLYNIPDLSLSPLTTWRSETTYIIDTFGGEKLGMPLSFPPFQNVSYNCSWPYHELNGKGFALIGKACSCPALIYTVCFHIGTSLMAQMAKNLPAIQEAQVQPQGQEDPLEKEMSTHCSILAWEIPWTEEPGGGQPMGSWSWT